MEIYLKSYYLKYYIKMTYIFIIVTTVISIISFSNRDLFGKLLMNPYLVLKHKQYYRVISHAFVHADWLHLIVNMFVLFSFGVSVERYFEYLASKGYILFPQVWFSLLYFLAIIISSLPTLYKKRNDSYYNCVGASGAVSAVLFCHIFFAPFAKLYLYAFLPLPGILFGVAYLIYSQYMSNKNMDNINHDAHFTGAVFGFLFPLLISYRLMYDVFLYQILKFFNN
jgi:membrane associated rhomboid family serine protease